MKLRKMVCVLLLAALMVGLATPALALERGQLLMVANCKRAALRSDNSARSHRLAKLPAGALVVYGGLTQGGFRLVRWGAQWGYVGENCLETASRALRTTKKVWLRAAPAESGPRLKKLKKGATLLAVSDGENGYLYVCYDGAYGYVHARYLRAAKPKQGMKAVALRDTTLRLGSGGKRHVPALTAVRCFGRDGEGREYVCVDGAFGFVDARDLFYKKRRR